MASDEHTARVYQTGRAEIGYHEDLGEVWVEMEGERHFMQPDEARGFAELLNESADAVEGENE